MGVALPGIEIPLVICVLYLGTHITSDYVFPIRETLSLVIKVALPGQHISIVIYVPLPGKETHITSYMCFRVGKHISVGICVWGNTPHSKM